MVKRGEVLILAGVGLLGVLLLSFLREPSDSARSGVGTGRGAAGGGGETLPFGGTSGLDDSGGTGGAPPPGEGGPQFVFNFPGSDGSGAPPPGGFTAEEGPGSSGSGSFTQRFVENLFSPENLAFTAPFLAIPAIAAGAAAVKARRAAQAAKTAAVTAQAAGGVPPRSARPTPGRAPRLPKPIGLTPGMQAAVNEARAAQAARTAAAPAKTAATVRAAPSLGAVSRVGRFARVAGPIVGGALTAVQVADVAGAIASGSKERAGASVGFTPEQTARFAREGPTVSGFFEAIGTGLKSTFIDAPLSLIPTAAGKPSPAAAPSARAAAPAAVGPLGVQALQPSGGQQFQRSRPGVAPRIPARTFTDLTEEEKRALRA